MTNTEQGFVFTSDNGAKYKTTKRFEPAQVGEMWVSPTQWGGFGDNTYIEQKFVCTQTEGETPGPVIIIEPVETTYEVTVTLTEEQLDRIAKTDDGDMGVIWEGLWKAIKAGKYREVTE